MTKSETIYGNVLTFEEHSEYKGEWVARWKGYTIAVAAEQHEGSWSITEFHPDGISTTYDFAQNLEAAWHRIKIYLLTYFINELTLVEE